MDNPLSVAVPGSHALIPMQVAAAGAHATRRFIEFFSANLRNRNTRQAYAQAFSAFFRWCEQRGLAELGRLEPVHVAAYVEQLGKTHAAPSVKQHLAAVRMLFDWLVVGQVVRSNPASRVPSWLGRSSPAFPRLLPSSAPAQRTLWDGIGMSEWEMPREREWLCPLRCGIETRALRTSSRSSPSAGAGYP